MAVESWQQEYVDEAKVRILESGIDEEKAEKLAELVALEGSEASDQVYDLVSRWADLGMKVSLKEVRYPGCGDRGCCLPELETYLETDRGSALLFTEIG